MVFVNGWKHSGFLLDSHLYQLRYNSYIFKALHHLLHEIPVTIQLVKIRTKAEKKQTRKGSNAFFFLFFLINAVENRSKMIPALQVAIIKLFSVTEIFKPHSAASCKNPGSKNFIKTPLKVENVLVSHC